MKAATAPAERLAPIIEFRGPLVSGRTIEKLVTLANQLPPDVLRHHLVQNAVALRVLQGLLDDDFREIYNEQLRAMRMLSWS